MLLSQGFSRKGHCMQRPDSPGDETSRNTSDLKSLLAELDSTPITEMNVDSLISRLDVSTASKPTTSGGTAPVGHTEAGSRRAARVDEAAARPMSGPALAKPTIDDDGSDEHDDAAGQFIPSFHDVNPADDDSQPTDTVSAEAVPTTESSAPTPGMPRMDISPDVLSLWSRNDDVYDTVDTGWEPPDIGADQKPSDTAPAPVSDDPYPRQPSPDVRPEVSAPETLVAPAVEAETMPTRELPNSSDGTPGKKAETALKTASQKAKSAAQWYRSKDTRVKIAIGLAVAIVVLTCVRTFSGGGGTEIATAGGPAAVVEQAETPAPVNPQTTDGVLQPDSITAECPSGSSRPELALSADPKDAWVCVRAQGIDGAMLTLTFRRPVVITEVSLVPGFNYVEASGVDRWTEHRLPTKLLWTFNDDTELVQDIIPARTGATMKVNAVATQTVSLTVMQTDSPKSEQTESDLPFALSPSTGTDSFALSHLQITGHEA